MIAAADSRDAMIAEILELRLKSKVNRDELNRYKAELKELQGAAKSAPSRKTPDSFDANGAAEELIKQTAEVKLASSKLKNAKRELVILKNSSVNSLADLKVKSGKRDNLAAQLEIEIANMSKLSLNDASYGDVIDTGKKMQENTVDTLHSLINDLSLTDKIKKINELDLAIKDADTRLRLQKERIEELTEQNAIIEEGNRVLDVKYEESLKIYEELGVKEESLRNQLASLSATKGDTTSTLAGTRAHVEDLRKNLAVLMEQEANIKAKAAKKKEENAKLRKCLEEAKKELREKTEAMKKKDEEHEARLLQIKEEGEAKKVRLEKDIEEAKEKLGMANKKIEDRETCIKLKSELANIGTVQGVDEGEMDGLRKELIQLKEEINQHKNTSENYDAKRLLVNQQYEELRAHVEARRAEEEKACVEENALAEQLEREAINMKNQVEEEQKEAISRARLVAETRRLLEKAKEEKERKEKEVERRKEKEMEKRRRRSKSKEVAERAKKREEESANNKKEPNAPRASLVKEGEVGASAGAAASNVVKDTVAKDTVSNTVPPRQPSPRMDLDAADRRLLSRCVKKGIYSYGDESSGEEDDDDDFDLLINMPNMPQVPAQFADSPRANRPSTPQAKNVSSIADLSFDAAATSTPIFTKETNNKSSRGGRGRGRGGKKRR